MRPTAAPSGRMPGWTVRLPLFIGGFMGPFGTMVIVPMFPEVAGEFDTSIENAALSFSVYLFTFAVALLFSGTLGERWGRRRTVRITYVFFAATSIAAALAPTLGIFIAIRGLQGIANAFITPLLIAGLAEVVPANEFGRQVGIYSSFQALGGGLGPILGGIAADIWWPLAFWGTAIAAAALALVPPPGQPRLEAEPPPWRPLLRRRPILLGLAFGLAALGPFSITVLVGTSAREILDLAGTPAGIIIFVGAMSALVSGPLWGWVIDRFGLLRMVPVALLVATFGAMLPALATDGLSLGLAWAVTSAAAAFGVVALQALGATVLPDNRGGGLSFLLSFRFLGHAIGPMVFIPLLLSRNQIAFVAAGAVGLVALAAVLASGRPPVAAEGLGER